MNTAFPAGIIDESEFSAILLQEWAFNAALINISNMKRIMPEKRGWHIEENVNFSVANCSAISQLPTFFQFSPFRNSRIWNGLLVLLDSGRLHSKIGRTFQMRRTILGQVRLFLYDQQSDLHLDLGIFRRRMYRVVQNGNPIGANSNANFPGNFPTKTWSHGEISIRLG